MRRRLLASAAAVGLALAIAAPAHGSAWSSTVTFHNELTPISDTEDPCAAAVGWAYVNGVMHESGASNGSYHWTGTLTGDFHVTIVGSGRHATGYFTVWFGGNDNVVTADDGTMILFWETLAVHGTYSDDGSDVRINIVEQLRIAPDGTVTLWFMKANCHD